MIHGPALELLAHDLLALVLPVDCAGCGAPDRALCSGCVAALRPDVHRRDLPDGTPVDAGLRYEGVPREVVIAFKQGRTGLARCLAPALAAAVRAAAPHPAGVEVCAVPSTRGARRRRGFEPVRALLAAAGMRPARVLGPGRAHPAQKTLDRDARAAHLDGVFVPLGPLGGRRLLLVDDVVTTGATLAATARALRAAGAEVVGCAVLASTPLRHDPGSPDRTLRASTGPPG